MVAYLVAGALPPAEYLTCADEPLAPDLPPRDGTTATEVARDVMTLGYVLAFRTAFGDCKGDLAAVKAWAERVD